MWKQELLETEHGIFEVFISGEGDPLCITHLYSEFNDRGNYFADSFTEAFTVYLVNLRSAGNSRQAADENEFSMRQGVEDLEAIRCALQIDSWSFAGHSTGAMLGLVYGVESPGSLEKILINAGAGSYEYMNHPDCIYNRSNSANSRVLQLLDIIKTSESVDERRAASKEWTQMSIYRPERYEEYFSKPSSGKVVGNRLDYFSYQELPAFNLFEQLPHVNVPAIISCGKYDRQCPLDCSIEIHESLPHSELVIFNESNHNAFLEEEQAFNQLVHRFNQLRA
ncbi:alpha/beta fold hydrolase [Alkalihalobacillus sp. NPDC078783]